VRRFTQKAAKDYFHATLWLLDLQRVLEGIKREKIFASNDSRACGCTVAGCRVHLNFESES
jgi:hypothetical protein